MSNGSWTSSRATSREIETNHSNRSIRVRPFYLTSAVASERIYGDELEGALENLNVQSVDNWQDADVVHLFEVNVFTREALKAHTFPTLYRILRSDVPVVVSTDDLYFIDDPSLTARPLLYGINSRAQQWLFRRCDGIIAMSRSVKESISAVLPNANIHVVYHGVSERYFGGTSETESPTVLHVSFPSNRKNPETLLAVAEQLDSRVVIAGGGWEDQFDDDQLAENIEVTGYVPEEELVELYHTSDVFYFPTLHEGFGLPLLEAMASTNAIVASDVYAVPEVTGKTAILHDPLERDAHVRSLEELLADRDRRTTLANAARERARQFSWRDTAKQTRAVYESVLDTNSSDKRA